MPITVDITVCRERYRVEIQNDCTGNDEVGNYNVHLWKARPNQSCCSPCCGELIARTHVSGHKRGDWKRLLAEVFAELGKE